MQQSAPPPPVANPNPGPANRQWRRSLLLRILTAVVGIPTILILLWFGGWVVFGAIAIIIGWASFEMHRMLTGAGMRPLSLFSLALSLNFLVAAILPAWRMTTHRGWHQHSSARVSHLALAGAQNPGWLPRGLGAHDGSPFLYRLAAQLLPAAAGE